MPGFIPILNNMPSFGQIVGSSTAAYSLRKINPNYSGPAINVRRSSDSTTKDIGFVNGVLDTASLAAFAGQNLVLQSENIGTSWTLQNVTAAASGTNPAGGAINTITANSTSTINRTWLQTLTKAASALSYVISIDVLAGVNTYAHLRVDSGGGAGIFVDVNLSNGTIGNTGAIGGIWVLNSSSIVSLGSGWYRLTAVATSDGGTSIRPIMYSTQVASSTFIPTNPTNNSGDIVMYCSRFQVEQASVPLGYYKTTTTAQAAQNALIPTWYDQSGRGNNLTQATAANQPPIVTNGVGYYLNNVSYISFNQTGTTQSLANISYSPSGPISANAVAANQRSNLAVGTYVDVLFATNSSGGGSGFGVDTANSYITRSNRSISFEGTSTAISEFLNGGNINPVGSLSAIVQYNTPAIITVQYSSAAYNAGIGFYMNTFPNNTFYAANAVFEMIILPSVISIADRQTIEHNQEQFYGISGV